MGESDGLDELRSAGFALVGLSEAQLAALRELSEDEMRVLIEIRQQLAEGDPDVEAHVAETIGGLFF